MKSTKNLSLLPLGLGIKLFLHCINYLIGRAESPIGGETISILYTQPNSDQNLEKLPGKVGQSGKMEAGFVQAVCVD